jgi:hypothetical protein
MVKTTHPMIKIHDTSTDEVIEREMNDSEFEAYQAANAAEKVAAQAKAAAEAAKAAEKAALLTRLGITADEAKLLLG